MRCARPFRRPSCCRSARARRWRSVRADRARRGDGGLRRPARLRARGSSGDRDPGDLERDLRGRPRALGIGRALEALADALPRVLEAARSSLFAHGAASEAGRAALPPPLPLAQRTVGQLVAESIRLYGGTSASAPTRTSSSRSTSSPSTSTGSSARTRSFVSAPVFSAGYAYASRLGRTTPRRRSGLTAYRRWHADLRAAALLAVVRARRPSSGSRSPGSPCLRRSSKERR